MTEYIRGYSKKGRKVSAAIFIPLSVLFLVLSVAYGGLKDGIPWLVTLSLSLVLFTRLWWVFYPCLCLMFGSMGLWSAIKHIDWAGIATGSVILIIGLLIGAEKLLDPQER